MTHDDSRLARVIDFYESLNQASLSELGQIYADNAAFKDPFNEVRGVDAIAAIFRHMYVQVEAPRFIVKSRMADGDEAFLTWDFRFRMKSSPGKEECIRGATHLRFDAAGLVAMHRDYWDAAEELYEKLPLLGGFMRWLKRRAAS
ncbi:MAG TPA: nuclear transport factor 2 family protein [Burkholderiaceae bacterium]